MKARLGLALGGGAARGWAHIGVLRALNELGIKPDIIVGTSIGSLVGATYVVDYLDELESWVRSLSWSDVMTLLDIRFAGGLIHGEKVINRLREGLDGIHIENLELPFAAVATNLETGNEVWLREGLLLDAVRASIALPGLFSPIKLHNRWLVDGGLVNPVPVSLCRALGADYVIGVDLTAFTAIRTADSRNMSDENKQNLGQLASGAPTDRLLSAIQGMTEKLRLGKQKGEDPLPSMLDVAMRSLQIMTVRISRSRLAGEPADVLIVPKVGDVHLMEFHRAAETIQLGYDAVNQQQMELASLKGL